MKVRRSTDAPEAAGTGLRLARMVERPTAKLAAKPAAAEPVRADVVPIPPRLLDLDAASKYLGGISPWTVRSLVGRGELRAVRLPSVRHDHETGRRLLFDIRDLDDAISRWRMG